MRNLARMLTVLALLILSAMPTFAQSGRFFFKDDAGRLNRSAVETAARPLIDRGAYVAVYAVDSGKGTEFLNLLQDDGLRSGTNVNPNLVAIFVSFNDRYSEIRYGDRWSSTIGNSAARIQQDVLNSNLASGNASDAFSKSLVALESAAAGAPASSTTPGAAAPSGDLGFLPWCIGVLALLGVGGFGWNMLSKRRAVGQTLASASKAMQDARLKAGAAVADTAQLLRTSREKAQYDAVSYTKDDAAQVTEMQRGAEQQFLTAQEAFSKADDIAEKMGTTATEQQYKELTGSYAQIETSANEARKAIEAVEARRAELDTINQHAPAVVDDAKKALADAVGRVAVLGDNVSGEAVSRQIAEQINLADSFLADRRAAEASQLAQAASAAAAELSQVLTRVGALREGISAGRAAAERVTVDGYRIEPGLKAFDDAETVLGRVAAVLEQQGVPAARPLLDQAEALRLEGEQRGGGMPALREENTRRIAELRGQTVQLQSYIGEGRKAFDQVDEFAEATWTDIRGNGSEAEKAQADATRFIEQAEAGNTMETQTFRESSQALDGAQDKLSFANNLIGSVIQRLKDLETARGIAKDEVASAQKDIEQGWSFVRSNDADIDKVPEQALTQAATLLSAAQAELGQQRPNWLEVVKQAQEANRQADTALAQARSEVETIQKLREQLQRARQLLDGEVKKTAQFVQIHMTDLGPEDVSRYNAILGDVQRAEQSLAQIERVEDTARVNALRVAVDQYASLQRSAEAGYQEIYARFQESEKYREQVTAAVDSAQRAIDYADTLRARSPLGMVSNGAALLQQAHQLLTSIGAVHSEQQAQRAISRAKQAESYAQQAAQAFQNELTRHGGGGGMGGGFIPGVLIGQALDRDCLLYTSRCV